MLVLLVNQNGAEPSEERVDEGALVAFAMWECHYNGFRMMAPTVDSEIAIDMVNFRRCLPVRKARGSEWLIAVGTDPKKRLLLLSEGLWNEGWHGLLGMTVDSLPDVRG